MNGERYSPLSLPCPRGRQPAGGLPLQGEVPAFRVDSESLSFSEDLSYLPSSEDRLVRFGPYLPASQVLLEGSGPPSLGYRHDIVPVVGSTSLRVPSVQSAPSSTSESSSGRSRPPSHSPSLASETLVSSPSIASGGLSEEPSASSGPSSSAYLPLPSSSSGSPASFTLATFRKRGQEAGLSERAADFAAQSLRPSTRCSYDNRLAGFRKWCSQSSCDPYTASLGSIADFLVSLFDKNSSVSTIRGYRSAIASFHAGFPDGSTVSNSTFLTRLLKSFFLKRPPSRSLIPSWSLPSVLRSLTSSPFEPLHQASLFHLSLKTVFLLAVASGQRRSSLQALSIEPGHLRWENSGVRLIPKAFL